MACLHIWCLGEDGSEARLISSWAQPGLSTKAPTYGLFSMVASELSNFLHGSWLVPEQVPRENQVKVAWPYLTQL